MSINDKPVGFFDSGVGGISVLKQAINLSPMENYIYYGDSNNAPYGTKSVEQIKELSFKAVEFLIGKGAKAVVVACNTATSAAIEDLRSRYKDIPIIGIEPALKPAVELRRKGKIIVMATPVTLLEKKFSKLVQDFGRKANIVPLPCAGLVELIERGIVEGLVMNDFLKNKLNGYLEDEIASIVLGCTHYPFIRKELNKIIGINIPIIDGSMGTARQLRTQLLRNNLVCVNKISGNVEMYNSLQSDQIIDLSYKFLKL